MKEIEKYSNKISDEISNTISRNWMVVDGSSLYGEVNLKFRMLSYAGIDVRTRNTITSVCLICTIFKMRCNDCEKKFVDISLNRFFRIHK